MWWNDKLPDKIAEAAEKAGMKGVDMLAHLKADLDEEGRFADRWLLIGKEILLTMTGDGEVIKNIPLDQIKSVEEITHVGGGMLRAVTESGKIPIARYSNGPGRAFGYIARGFEKLRAEGALDSGPDLGLKKCPHCSRVLEPDVSVCPKCMSKGKVLVRLWSYARQFKARLAIIISILILGTAGSIFPIVMWKVFIDYVFHIQEPRPTWLPWLVLTYGAIILIEIGMRAVFEVQGAYVGMNLVYRVRRDLFNHVMKMGLPFFDKYRAGELMSRVDGDTNQLERLIIDAATALFADMVMVIGVVTAMFIMNWRLALIALVPLPVVVTISLMMVRWVVPLWHRMRQRHARLSASLNTSITGVRVVKAFAREERETDYFDLRSSQFRDTGIQLARTFAMVFPAMGFAMQSGVLLIWYFGGRQVLDGILNATDSMTLGDLMAFVGLLGLFYGPFVSLLHMSRWATHGLTAAQRVFDILDSEPDRYDQEAVRRMETVVGDIAFENVTFGYEPLKPVLKNVDLKITAGEMVGLVGHSGAGKTTTTNLILRFYTPEEGAIKIDGVDIREIESHDLRTHMASVPQEPYLFAGSVAENIAYGKNNATPESIIEAAMAANAHDFIMKMSDAYDSAMGEQGHRVSVGEKQRLTIARAVIQNPRILILDEATSSVDTDTEKQIQEALGRLIKNRTTIAIAHRLSTLKNADRLVVLKDGEVIEQGTHDELMEKRGEFFRLVQLQSDMSRIHAVGG